MKRSHTINTIKLVISVVVCLGAGFAGSFFTGPAIDDWYVNLVKPPFNPPNQIFAPVWTTLYILMAVSVFIIWRKGWGHKYVRSSLSLFVLQLFLNVLWSVLFFGLKTPGNAFIEIIGLWVVILLTIIRFRKLSITAAALLVPYILWVSFAGVLNYSIWALNH
jgi:tryptophan-rich sensory protein